MKPTKCPKTYEWSIDVRYSDLDQYNHVYSGSYLDFVITSRWQYIYHQLDLTHDQLLAKGVGFFLKRADMSYQRPIQGPVAVSVRSFVSEVLRDGRELEVSFEILSSDQTQSHSKGKLYFVVMDLSNPQSPKVQSLPDWLYPYFYDQENSVV